MSAGRAGDCFVGVTPCQLKVTVGYIWALEGTLLDAGFAHVIASTVQTDKVARVKTDLAFLFEFPPISHAC